MAVQNVQKVCESKSLIRFPDCDPFNHLNNSRYIDYFINAREDHLLQFHHFNIYQLARERNISWVVSKNQIAYLKPAFLMETVLIQTVIIKLEEKSILVEMRMWNEDKTLLKAFMWTQFVHFNLKTQKPESHSADLMDQFRPFVLSLPEATGFGQRLEQLKNNINSGE
jgi:acyl-CoA thioester hydrolase